MALGFGTKMCWGEREREGFSAAGECWWLTKSHSNILFCWLPPSLIIFWILRSWTVPHRLIMSPESALPTNRCFPCSLWRLFVAALIHQMCLFCTLMFVFSALLVLSNSSEQGGCCWIVRIEVGCWLEVTVNGLVLLTRDILRNTKDVAFTFLGEGAERERMCVDEWTQRVGPPHCSVRSDWLALSTSFGSQSNHGFWFYSVAAHSVLGSPMHAGQHNPSSWRAPHLCPGAPGYLRWAQP